MKILFDDENIVVFIKSPGTDSEQIGVQDVYGEAASGRLFCVHRLDRETGGVTVYAKNESTAAILSRGFADHSIRKTYLALCEGILVPESGRMEDLLFHDRRTNKTYVVKRERKGVKKAALLYETIKTAEIPGIPEQDTKPVVTLAKVKLETGRTHQIRIQFASRKHPLVGDRRYGAKTAFPVFGLWSCELSMCHPVTGEKMEFHSKPPWEIL